MKKFDKFDSYAVIYKNYERRNSNRTLSETQSSLGTITRLDTYQSSIARQLSQSKQKANNYQSPLIYSQRHSISDIAQTVKQRYGAESLDTGAVCDLCKVTKFTSTHTGGRVCSACKLRCCLRCSLRFSVPISLSNSSGHIQQRQLLWICVECKRKQDEIMKSSEWPTQVLKSLTSGASCKNTFVSEYILNRTHSQSNTANGNSNGQRSDANKSMNRKIYFIEYKINYK